MFSKSLRIAALAATAMVVMSSQAIAQSKILVVDTAKVISESTVGKYAESQLNSIGKSMESEIKAQTSPLSSKAKTLNSALGGKKTIAEVQQTFKSRPDLAKQYQELEIGKRKIAQESQVKTIEFQATEQKAYAQIAKKVKEIIDQIAREQNADVVFDKARVIYVNSAVDVTPTVMSRLNSQMTTISITRERLPRNN